MLFAIQLAVVVTSLPCPKGTTEVDTFALNETSAWLACEDLQVGVHFYL